MKDEKRLSSPSGKKTKRFSKQYGKRFTALLAALTVLLLAYSPIAAETDIPEWAGAYTWFLETEQYRKQPHSVIYWNPWEKDEPRLGTLSKNAYVDFVCLHDMNEDYIPEMFIHYLVSDDTDGEKTPYGCYVYALRGGHDVKCIGQVEYDVFTCGHPRYPGILGQFPQNPGENEYVWAYYELRDYWNTEPSDFPLEDQIGTGDIRMHFFEPKIVTWSLALDDPFISSLQPEFAPLFYPEIYNDKGTDRSNFREWPEYLNQQYGIRADSKQLLKAYEKSILGDRVNISRDVTYQLYPTKKMTVNFSTEMFNQFSKGWAKDIAELGIVLSSAAYDNHTDAGSTIYTAYQELGFQDSDIMLFNYKGHRLNTKGYERENHFEFSIASHPMGDYLLLCIIIRGTGLWGDDVGTDLNVEGFEIMGVQFHTGFMEFMWEILTGLQKYVDERPYFAQKLEEGKVKMLVTGHSLGAAAANLIGAYMMSDEYGGPKVPQDDLYVYCYATPRTFIRNWVNKAKTSDCFNIINVVINSDPVPAAPDDPRGEIWYRFGQTRFYINPFGVGKDHDTASYIEVVFNRRCEAQLRERWKDVIISK